ncbi:MAG: helix-turn-helix domain-containing protein [Erysipelotrichaceae bacterium]|nr:helix-turn-helix domain-containing protein [Erysipelotrichaceae bacterium]
MNVREMRMRLGDTQSEFAARYGIPFRTIQNWESGLRKPPEYILSLLNSRVLSDLSNHKTTTLPKYDPRKYSLPKRSKFTNTTEWLKAVQNCIGEDIVFALDEALMCQDGFLGRSDEYLIWVYGSDTLTRFNGIVVLGNQVSNYSVKEKDGLRFTDFNRTLSDAFANEAILDMQGITEALSKYYFRNNESFEGIFVSPEYQKRFEQLADDAIHYYDI